MTSYKVLDHNHQLSLRHTRHILDSGQVASFLADGFLIAPHGLSFGERHVFREASKSLLRKQRDENWVSGQYYAKTFTGNVVRHIHTQDLRFIDLLTDNYPFVALARSLLGPKIFVRTFGLRVTSAHSTESTLWHTDRHTFIIPTPPLYSEPHQLSLCIYLDGANAENGLFYVVPGSHMACTNETDYHQSQTIPGQIDLTCKPGESVLFHSALLHKGGSNSSDHDKYVLIITFAPTFCRGSFNIGEQPSAEFERYVDDLIIQDDEPMLELLGIFNQNGVYRS